MEMLIIEKIIRDARILFVGMLGGRFDLNFVFGVELVSIEQC